MDALEEGIAGFSKPLIDLIGSILVYVVLQTFTVMKSTLPSSAVGNNLIFSLISNPVIFFIIFTGVSLFEEVIWSVRKGYHQPFNASAKIIGILIGTFVFWGALVATEKSIGGSEIDIIISGAIAIGAMIIGVILRVKWLE